MDAILQRQDRLNLVNIGQIMDTLGLRVVLTRVPANRLGRVPAPALLFQNGHFGLLDGVEPDGRARLLEAELGALLVPAEELITHEGGLVELLLFDRKPDAKQRRFDWSWYGPFLRQHRRGLIEVLVASVVINALRIVFPLGLLVLIQSVLASRNIGALVSIASVMLLATLVESIFKTLRSFLFTDLANRIDQDAKATILDQLVRLPQGFFDARPVGQITFYFSQLDRLRDFLLGKTLPTLVDFAFSLLYLAILFAISPLLTLVTLATLPLIAAVGLVSNPLVRSQIKRTMGQAVRASSFLTEAITGIQTIKSQNAELKTRWEFQNRYAAYIGEDFKLKVTRESITNLSGFLSNLSQLLVLGRGDLADHAGPDEHRRPLRLPHPLRLHQPAPGPAGEHLAGLPGQHPGPAHGGRRGRPRHRAARGAGRQHSPAPLSRAVSSSSTWPSASATRAPWCSTGWIWRSPPAPSWGWWANPAAASPRSSSCCPASINRNGAAC